MAPILTPEDVVRRIAAECTFVDERGRRRHSAETGRRDRAAERKAIPGAAAGAAASPIESAAAPVSTNAGSVPFLHLSSATRKYLNGLAYGNPSKVLSFARIASGQTRLLNMWQARYVAGARRTGHGSTY
jgi:hypothetical protein